MNYFNKLLENNNRILIFGRYGQLGSTYYKHLSKNSNLLHLGSKDVNFLNSDHIPKIVNDFKPNYIINTSAFTDVNGAENNYKIANEINCNAVKILAEASKINKSILIHYSTDYIFDGKKKTGYNSSDIPNAINKYGKSKLKGEENIIGSGCDFFIFRVSWMVSEFGNNFIKTIITKLKNNDNLSVVNDQIGSPISSHLVAKITSKIIVNKINPKKIFHLSTRGKTSWYDIAMYISQVAKNINKSVKINALKSSEYKSTVLRPKNSLFDLTEIESILMQEMPFWKDDIKPIIKKLDYDN